MSSQASPDDTALSSSDRFLHLKSIDVTFLGQRPTSTLEMKIKVASLKHKSPEIQVADSLHWDCELYVEANMIALLVVQKTGLTRRSSSIIASFPLDFQSAKFAGDMLIELKDDSSGATAKIILGDAKSASDVTRLLAHKATMALASKINMLENFSKVLGCLNLAVEAGKEAAQFYPPLQPVVPIVSGALKSLQEIPNCHRELTSIMDDVTSVLPLLKRTLELAQIRELKEVIKDYFDIVRDLSQTIMEEYSVSNSKLVLRSFFKSSRLDANGLSRRMTKWKENADLALGADIQQGVADVQQGVVENQRGILAIHEHQFSEADEKSLEQLKPPERSWYDLDRRCLEGTRESVIQQVVEWSQSQNTPSRLFWLHGVAGCGKSSVATSVADRLHDLRNENFLSYSFFCKRDDPERRSVIRMIRAIAYYLASAFEPYRAVLLRKLKEKPTPLNNMLQNEFKALLLDCIKETSGSAPPPIIITLDALDECDEMEEVSKLLVEILSSASWIKLFVTSRPLPNIQRNLESSGTLFHPYDLFRARASTEADIVIYLKHQFEDGKELAVLRKHVTPEEIKELGRKALGLFIWITVVCSYIGRDKSGRLKRFQDILHSKNASNSEQQLDKLYLEVLKHAAGPDETGVNIADIRLITGLVLATSRNRPLPAAALFAFGSPEYHGLPEEWQGMLEDLRSVLITDTGTNDIRVCHKSFLDFLGSRERSGEFWTEPTELERLMAKQCLRVMLAPSGLRFNMCELKTSYLPNRIMKDLNVEQQITRELQYSCLYWFDHLSKCGSGFSSPHSIRDFLHRLFFRATSLYWLEVLSLLSELREAVLILDAFMKLLKNWSHEDELYSFANDLYRFVKAFHEPMAMSTPHIYISALIWAPSECVIAKSIGPTFNSRACILDGHNKRWPNTIQTMCVDSGVKSVAYSPDGRYIVSGSSDGAMRIWDAETGAPVGKPLLGHSGEVNSVSYSPDGRRIVTGSEDGTIRMWDAETGAPVGKPLLGHSGEVNSMSYSPDGRRIVSGSEDGTIRMWDAETGAPVGKPLLGHSGEVNSMSYSPDGRRIVSGSEDGTIRIWDAETGAPVGEPLLGHSDEVNSVSYSPDGRRIVTGSEDGTIRIWDAETCASVGEPLRGDDGSVFSVNHSPDGRRIVSGSEDGTISIRDAETGASVGEPLRGHDSWVLSVSYSLNGRRIVSGSRDGTIRIWDAETGAPVGKPLRDHDDWVWSVNYSPDGRRIVSGSEDGTISIRDAETGASVGEPLRGHDSWVLSVSYSLNGRRIVSGSRDGTIRIWDAETGAPVGKPLRDHDDWVWSVNYSPDGRRIVSGSEDGTISIWDAETSASVGEPLLGHNDLVQSVNYSPDGRRIVSGSSDGTIRMWDAETSAPVGEPLLGHSDGVNSVSYSPDGRRIVSGSSDGTIRIWDAETSAPVCEPLLGHSGEVNSVSYSPDGRRIVSGSEDGTIRMWDAKADAPFASSLRHRGDVVCPVATSVKQTDSILGAEIRTPFDTSSWEEGKWKYCIDDQCFVSRNSETPEGTDPVTHSRFPRQIPPDGWIRTINDGLLLWIPPDHRHGVCDMSLFCLPRNTSGHHVGIDWTKLRYGSSWTAVKVEK